MKWFNRKSVSFFTLFILLFVSVFLNWKYNGGGEENAKVLGEAAYVSSDVDVEEKSFDAMKIERNTARDETVKSLKEIIDNPNVSEGAKADAENSMLFINQARIQEVDCESILKNKGFQSVMVGITNEGVNVFVEKKELSPTDIAIITETIKSNTPFTENFIKISTSD